MQRVELSALLWALYFTTEPFEQILLHCANWLRHVCIVHRTVLSLIAHNTILMTMTATKPQHEFRSSLSENDIFERIYYRKVLSPLLREDGYMPVDLRADSKYRKADIDFGGMLDGTVAKTIEVKFDHVAAVTGNMFLETVSVDKGVGHAQTPGCFMISEADEFHQIVVMQNQVYVSDLPAMRDYWYGEEAVPRIWRPEYARHVMRNIRAYNQTYDSIGDCVSIELLFGENHPHHSHYLIDVYEFDDSLLETFVPMSAKIVNKYHSIRQKAAELDYPKEVSKWLV